MLNFTCFLFLYDLLSWSIAPINTIDGICQSILAGKPNIARVYQFLNYLNNDQNNHPKDHIWRMRYNFGCLYKKYKISSFQQKRECQRHIGLLSDYVDEEEGE